MPHNYISCDLEEILIGETLPATIYLYIDFRFITFRSEGDVVDLPTYERLELKKVRAIFIQETDRDKFTAWTKSRAAEPTPPPQTE